MPGNLKTVEREVVSFAVLRREQQVFRTDSSWKLKG